MLTWNVALIKNRKLLVLNESDKVLEKGLNKIIPYFEKQFEGHAKICPFFISFENKARTLS